jgi:acetyl-CoA synthetase
MMSKEPGRDRPGYEQAVARFSIEAAMAALQGDLAEGVNACVECCDRHCGTDRVALRCVSAEGAERSYTFEELRELSARTANLLRDKGIKPGDVVAGLLPRTVELVAVILGAWRLGAVYQPLFTAFGPKAIEHRLKTSGAKMVVTNTTQRPKLDEIPDCPLVATVGHGVPASDVDFRAGVAAASDAFEPVMRRGDDLFMMMSTSGTTGLPKGVPVPLRALLAFGAYMRDAIDLRDGDVFWNIADPGWAYGLYYALTGPLLLGQATAATTFDLIARLGVTNLAGSPTAFRLLIAAGPEAAAGVKGRLRVVSSAGEPLNPEIIRWFEQNLAAPIHDHYGQTEMGMCVNNHHGLDHPVRPGSAGLAMPGYRVVVLDEAGRELGPNQPGILAIDLQQSPLMWFSGYLHKPPLSGRYYSTGDSVEFEPDGSISFIGRADDVITSSGYRIGPFDVESALIEHPAVVEAAVVGVPDPERTEIVKAFVILAKGATGSEALREELQAHVKRRLSAHAWPKLLDFVEELPKTPSGKIQRFLLRKAEVEKQAHG